MQSHPNELVLTIYLHKPFAEQFDKQLFISIFWVNKSTSWTRFNWNNELNANKKILIIFIFKCNSLFVFFYYILVVVVVVVVEVVVDVVVVVEVDVVVVAKYIYYTVIPVIPILFERSKSIGIIIY